MKDVDILNIQDDLIHLPGTFDNEEIYWFFFLLKCQTVWYVIGNSFLTFIDLAYQKKKSFLLTLWKDTYGCFWQS